MEVKAIKNGFYGTRRRPGDVFELVNPDKEFSSHWMIPTEKVPDVSEDEKPPSEWKKPEIVKALHDLGVEGFNEQQTKKAELLAMYEAAIADRADADGDDVR